MSKFLRYPPVYGRLRWSAVLNAARAQMWGAAKSFATAKNRLESLYPDHSAVLTDSGTSALTLALNASRSTFVSSPQVVALPGFSCPDVASAAIGAEARIVLYDIDPSTLQPDMDSLRRCFSAGATHVVVAHFYGRLTDVAAVRQLATEFNIVVIEDAAQHAGGMRGGVRGGGLAPFGVLSFGRGKGINAGGGGALLVANGDHLPPPLLNESVVLAVRDLAAAAVGELLSTPWLYWAPASIPGSGIGSTVYHEPRTPRAMSASIAVLLTDALEREDESLRNRQWHAREYRARLAERPEFLFEDVHEGTVDGALRFPVRVTTPPPERMARLGLSRSYPRTLRDYPRVREHIISEPGQLLGATQLAATTYTLPTHEYISAEIRDVIIDYLLSEPT